MFHLNILEFKAFRVDFYSFKKVEKKVLNFGAPKIEKFQIPIFFPRNLKGD